MNLAFLVSALLISAGVAADPAGPTSSTITHIKPGEGHVLIPWNLGEQFLDRPVLVYGKVVKAKRSQGRSPRCYLNFHSDHTTTLTVTLSSGVLDAFGEPPETHFQNRMIAVRGRINGEVGKPELPVTAADQIMILPDASDVLSAVRARYPGVITPDMIKRMGTRRAGSDAVRVGTYNILNLFDELEDPYRDDEVMSPKPRADMERVAARIRELDADVLALQEVENRAYLETFVRCFLPDMGYEHIVLFEGNNHRGIDCAVLSRLPVGPVTSYRHLRFPGPDGKSYRFQRDLLRVRIEGPEDFRFDVFAVHLKSKYGGAERSEPIRQAEATCIRKILDDLLYQDPQARFVICGDFNDTWDSAALKIIRGSGQTALTCPVSALDPRQQVTYNREPFQSMIDFLLCSPGMGARYIADSYRIISGTVAESGSDHNPVVATFRTR